MGVIVDIMQIASVRRIIEAAEADIEKETGAAVKLTVLIEKNELIDFDFIIKLTCSLTSVPAIAIVSKSRNRNMVDARKIITVLARDFLESTWAEIGSKLGQRDHTTAIHLFNEALNHIKIKDPMFMPKYHMVRMALLQNLERIQNETKTEQ